MTKITQTEAIEKCAAAMGYVLKHDRVYRRDTKDKLLHEVDYNPLEPRNLHQAFELLERIDSIGPRMYQSPDKTWNVIICTSNHYKDRYWANNKSLNAAIVLAVLQAVHGETYELAEG